MSKQITFAAKNIPTSSILEFQTRPDGSRSITILDGEVARRLDVVNGVVTLDFRPNEFWLGPWLLKHGVKLTCGKKIFS